MHDYLTYAIKDRHVQTLLRSIMLVKPIAMSRQRLELADGDFLDCDWLHCPNPKAVVLVIPGLTGNSYSHYVQQLLKQLHSKQYTTVVMNHRGTSGETNRLVSSYHSGKTDDLQLLLALVQQKYKHLPCYAVGYSLGGNVLLKFLGENPHQKYLDRSIAVSVPFQLNQCAEALNNGFSRIYQHHLISGLQRSISGKIKLGFEIPNRALVQQSRTFWEFDHHYTAMAHGFEDVHDYYAKSSCFQFLHNIASPTNIIHADDDPFVPQQSIPNQDDVSVSVQLHRWRYGGHVGFWTFKWGEGYKDALTQQIVGLISG